MGERLTAPSAPGPTAAPRRSFLEAVLGFGFFSSIVAIVYPVTRYLVPPAVGEPPTASVVVARIADVAPNTGHVFKFGNRPALLIRSPEGALRAFNAICTHLDCTVQYRSDSSVIWCACHDGVFDLGGSVVSGPPPRPLERLVINLRGEPGQEEVVVSRS
jgi:Rieske Fe-S protein